MENKNLTIDIVKGIAILLVVYGHVIEHSMAPWQPKDFFENPVFKIIYTFHMPLFVFISGYLMADSLKRHSVRDVIQSRCKSLIIPFLFLSLLGTLVACLLNIIFDNNCKFDPLGVVATQLFLDPKVWFLFTLFMLSFLLLSCAYLEKYLGVIAFGVLYFLIMSIPYHDYGALYYIQWFYLFYAAGYCWNRAHLNISNRTIHTWIWPLSLIAFCALLPSWRIDDYIYINKMHVLSQPYYYGPLRLIYRYIMGFLGITLAFYLGAYLSKTKIASRLAEIGTYSLDIYIIQMLILEGIYPRVISKAAIHLDFSSPLVLFVMAPLITVFFVGTSMLISTVFVRSNHVLNTLLLGGRAVVPA